MTNAERFHQALRQIMSVPPERAEEINRQFPMEQPDRSDDRRYRKTERQDRRRPRDDR